MLKWEDGDDVGNDANDKGDDDDKNENWSDTFFILISISRVK